MLPEGDDGQREESNGVGKCWAQDGGWLTDG